MVVKGEECGIEEGADGRRDRICGPVIKPLLGYEVECTRGGGIDGCR